MDTLFKFLGEQPIALDVLLVLIVVLFIVVVWAIVLATKRGSDISFWGLRIRGTRIVGQSSNLLIEIGSEDIHNHHDFYEDIQKSKRTCSVSVEFKQTFKTTPQIFVALKKIDPDNHIEGSSSERYSGVVDAM